MKKAYESPKVEKMVFNYSEAVVASTGSCWWDGKYRFGGENCTQDYVPGTGEWHGNNT